MIVSRIVLALGGATALFAAAPASAQFFMKSHDFSGVPVRGDEPGIGIQLPGASEAEIRAALVWNLRAALNVSALQCQFEPMLLALPNYNAVLKDHQAELKASYDTLTKYFLRTAATKKAGATALDQFGTRVYASYSTAAAQFGFCQTTGSIGRDAIFQPRGTLYQLAIARTRELRNSLIPYGEERFPGGIGFNRRVAIPRLDKACWSRRGDWNEKRCGPIQYLPS